jgi:predicted enzyme related to lactoylglutathione lyase
MSTTTTTTRNQQPKEHTLVHFEIPSNNPEKVRRFYEQLFGWKFNKMPGTENMEY